MPCRKNQWSPLSSREGETRGGRDPNSGIINLVLEDDRVRFEVNLNAAEQARLRIRARLLTVAKLALPGKDWGGG